MCTRRYPPITYWNNPFTCTHSNPLTGQPALLLHTVSDHTHSWSHSTTDPFSNSISNTTIKKLNQTSFFCHCSCVFLGANTTSMECWLVYVSKFQTTKLYLDCIHQIYRLYQIDFFNLSWNSTTSAQGGFAKQEPMQGVHNGTAAVPAFSEPDQASWSEATGISSPETNRAGIR